MAKHTIGTICVVERRFAFQSRSEKPQKRYELTITKLTPKRVYIGGDCWFALDDPYRELKPRYLDYQDHVVEIKP